MIIPNLTFYNHFHNGDIHYSREFVKNLMSLIIHDNCYYQHPNSNVLLSDIDNIIHNNITLPSTKTEQQSIVECDNLLINTWVGQQKFKYYFIRQCSLYSNYAIYTDLYKMLNLKIEPIEYYIPTINYEKFEINNVKAYIENINFDKKVLISNGDVYSGQSDNFEFFDHVSRLASEHPNILFILTNNKRHLLTLPNMIYTEQIIKKNGCDLNEISYLSTFCDIIVGRASGAFCFTHVKENLNNLNKTFIAFCNKRNDGLWFEECESNQIWSNDYSCENIYNIIKNEIIKIL